LGPAQERANPRFISYEENFDVEFVRG